MFSIVFVFLVDSEVDEQFLSQEDFSQWLQTIAFVLAAEDCPLQHEEKPTKLAVKSIAVSVIFFIVLFLFNVIRFANINSGV